MDFVDNFLKYKSFDRSFLILYLKIVSHLWMQLTALYYTYVTAIFYTILHYIFAIANGSINILTSLSNFIVMLFRFIFLFIF